MLAHTFSFIFVLTGAGLTAAQSLPITLTSNCSTTLQSLLTSPDTGCLNLGPLLSFVINPAQSIPQTANTWLTGLCATESCTDSNIANVVANFTQGCGEDLSNLGIETAGLQDQIISSVQQAYPTIRQVACLKDTITNELCVTQTLNNVEKAFGNLVVDNSLTPDILNQDAQTFLNSNLTQIACTSCAQAAYEIGIAAFPAEVSEANSTLELACGASFFNDSNGTTNVAQTALSKRSPVAASSGSIAFTPLTLASRGLLAILGASVLLA